MAPMMKTIRRLNDLRLGWRLRRYAIENPLSAQIIQRVREQRLSYLKPEALWDLALAVREVERMKLDGAIIEAGCALGGSSLVLASSKSKARPFLVFDAFGLIPPPSEKDGAEAKKRYELISGGGAKGLGTGDRYYGYEPDLYERVNRSFSEFGLETQPNNIQLIKGLYQHTLHLNSACAFAHIDSDWYDSVMVCLQEIAPRLVPGGRIVVDDYEAWSGCRKAVDEYFDGTNGKQFRFVRKSRLHIVKRRSAKVESRKLKWGNRE